MMRRMDEALTAVLLWEPLVSLAALLLGWVVGAWQWVSGKTQISELKKGNERLERDNKRLHRALAEMGNERVASRLGYVSGTAITQEQAVGRPVGEKRSDDG